MSNPVIQALMDRRSVRVYTDEAVSQKDLDTVLECAINSPSAMNNQPWHLTVIKDRAWLDKMNLAVRAGVQAQDASRTFKDEDDFFYHAPIAVFVSAKNGGAGTDCGMLTQNFCIAAQGLGLGTCVIGMAMVAINGKDGESFLADMKLPEGYRPHYAIILGHPGETPAAKPRDAAKVSYM